MKRIRAALQMLQQDIKGNTQLNQKITLGYIFRTASISLYISIKYGTPGNKKAGMTA
ncbi:MAG: hypothetical protein N2513_10530 [Deltaproteobacteria bacterium]|nr:hypothetical protein [Deltaproteobacteria bacterium]